MKRIVSMMKNHRYNSFFIARCIMKVMKRKEGIYMLEVTLLGSGGSIPLPDRYLSATTIEYNGRKILIDSGEGTQVSMRAINSGFRNIDVICITHLHGDHVIGLQGMLGTTSNSGRTEPITIIGPKGLKDVLAGFRLISPFLNYEVNVIEDPKEPVVIENDHIHGELSIEALPVEHTRPCLAYRVNLARDPKFDVQKARENEVPQPLWGRLQKEHADIAYEGKVYTPDMVLGEPRPGLSVSLVTDTLPIPSIIPFVKDSDLFICCSNYGNQEDKGKADKNKHMTFEDSATLAKEANVNTLMLTHYSQAMRHPEEYIDNARAIFPHTVMGQDHIRLELNYDEKHPTLDYSLIEKDRERALAEGQKPVYHDDIFEN